MNLFQKLKRIALNKFKLAICQNNSEQAGRNDFSFKKAQVGFKACYYQYNTGKSLNCKGIAVGQIIFPNHHSFQLEKLICSEILRSVAIRTKSLTLAQVAPNTDHHRKVLIYTVQSSGAQAEHIISKYWESTPRMPCKANFRSRSIFSDSSYHLSNSLSLVEWMNMCKLCEWLFDCNKCAITILDLAFQIIFKQQW
ncbi:Hypothetical_protein [Hexamita inflata]|uniref:Hypothetical_protein n=1 Tax=Hexamita inflata TaxID=28002 RepID=A0AA86QIE0_9EUKA|nr:Hypothetical protein HINF_LOCUS47644 [Hexamita inflata]